MSDFIEKLGLAEKAAEDIYFARVNRELIDALHKRRRLGKDDRQSSDRTSTDTQAKTSRLP